MSIFSFGSWSKKFGNHCSTRLLKCMSGSQFPRFFRSIPLILLSSILLRRSFRLGGGRYMNGTVRAGSQCSRPRWAMAMWQCWGLSGLHVPLKVFLPVLLGQEEHHLWCWWPDINPCLNTLFRHKYICILQYSIENTKKLPVYKIYWLHICVLFYVCLWNK